VYSRLPGRGNPTVAPQSRLTYVRVTITRVVNTCVLLEFPGDAVLTDPYFVRHWFLRLREPIGLNVSQLPVLTAILGGHSALDHWQPQSMTSYPFKDTTPVYTATSGMAVQGRRFGFDRSEALEWFAERQLSDGLSLEVAPAQVSFGLKANSYVLSSRAGRIYIGTESCDLAALRRYRDDRPAVDIALLPIDGSQLFGRSLVMDAGQAIEGARILGARILIPFHYALRALPPILRMPTGLPDLLRLSAECSDVAVVPLNTGQRWSPELHRGPV